MILQEGSNLLPENMNVTGACPAVSAILSRIGDKWSVLIVMQLGIGAKRFNEIKRSTGGISQRMLTLTLRGLERDGLVSRLVHHSIPPKVEYSLTDLGRSLLEPVKALGVWAITNQKEIHAAQRRFDEVRADERSEDPEGAGEASPRRKSTASSGQAAD
jgi:DNA-binding HxlR family transcriptional regulator